MQKPSLSAPQNIFLNGLNTKYRAYIGGFGSGKSFVGCLDLLRFAGEHPKVNQGYFAPTYPAIRDIFYPTITEAAEMMGFTVKINESNKEVFLYRAGFYYGCIICRSMDKPQNIVGFKIARALVDEIDVIPKDKATNAWNKIVARLRLKIDGVVNGIGVTTTPEGFLFAYSKFANNPTESYSMVQASTYENEDFLPDDYVDTLIETYPSNLIKAYLQGKFVNLTSGSVYPMFDRQSVDCNEQYKDGDVLHIGMDFNVNKMAGCIFVQRGNDWRQIDEVKDGRDTPQMIEIIQQRYPNSKVIIYPDASGKNASSKGASLSDISLLRKAGFQIRAKDSNPPVKDRVASVNKALEDGKIKINVRKCPTTADHLEQQPYDANGQPDKKSGLDHMPDAFGYFVYYTMPIIKPVSAPKVSRFR